MKMKLLHSIIFTMIATTSFAQNSSVEYDMQDSEGRRLIQTRSVVALKPSKTIFPISIGLDYYEAIPGCYYLMLYGRYPLSESTILALTFEDGETVNVEPYSLNGKARYSNAVSGVTIGGATYKGVFLYPDNYNGVVVSSSMSWNDINAAGIVFLPAAGYYDYSYVSGVGYYGRYWSSTAEGIDNAHEILFYEQFFSPSRYYRRGGFSVRLVTDVK